jgi:hypothetical protein
MLHMFAMIFKGFYVFLQVFQAYVASVFTVSDMLHVFYLDVVKVDRDVAHVTSKVGSGRRRSPRARRKRGGA